MKKLIPALAVSLLLAGCASAAVAADAVQQESLGWRATCTTSSAGTCTTPNNAGVVPDSVTVTPRRQVGVAVTAATASTITLSFTRPGSSSAYVGSVTFDVHADFTPPAPGTSPTPTPTITTTLPTTQPTTPPTTTPTVDPTTDPTVDPTGRACPAFPAFPDASCTGVPAGVTLHACNGEITTAGAKLDSCLFTGGVTIAAANVEITRSKVLGMVGADYRTNWNLSGLKLTDVEIDGSGYVTANGEAAIGYDNYSCLRCNVHHTGRGFNFANGVTIQDSWSHDFWAAPGAHQSAAGSNGGAGNRIIHNRLDCSDVNTPTGGAGCSGALVLYGDFDPVNDVVIQNNLFDGGSYCLYPGADSVGKPYPNGTNIRVLDNRFGRKYPSEPAGGQDHRCGYYGPVQSWKANTGNVWSGNAWADGSGAVNP